MISLTDLTSYLDKLMQFDPGLDAVKIDPYMTNGLLVKGSDKLEKIGYGVSASLALFKKAREEGCQAIVVHHSFNLPAGNNYDPIYQNRISYLIKNDISLYGYHFLLDAHPEIGNNVRILKAVGANPVKPYMFQGNPWGYTGTYAKPIPLHDIKTLLKDMLSPFTVNYDFGPTLISKVVAVSGKGAPPVSAMKDLINDKVGLYITGEVHEWNRELFREAGINLIAGGHYHTECFGIKAIMEKVKSQFPRVPAVWLDLPNEI